MHTQTESAKCSRTRKQTPASATAALVLYFLTLAGEAMLGAPVRWLLVYLGATIVGALVPLGLSAEGLAWIAAVAPLAHSVLGFALPGQGRLWRRRLGARLPTAEEQAVFDGALEVLRAVDPTLRAPAGFYVLDRAQPGAKTRGRAMIFSRGALDCEALPALLAHELGHADTLDGRVTLALGQLVLWEDPLGPVKTEGWEYPSNFGGEGRFLYAFARWALRFAGATVSQQLLKSFWALHWRSREFAADANAARLGQAPDLAQYLTEQELPFDSPRRHTFFDCSEKPPAAQRIERLLASSGKTGSE